jgi:hypothetical protein
MILLIWQSMWVWRRRRRGGEDEGEKMKGRR